MSSGEAKSVRVRVAEWKSYVDDPPTEAGVYRWRVPSEAVPGLVVTYLGEFRKRGAGYRNVLSPDCDYWNGYVLTTPRGLEWCEADAVEGLRLPAELAVDGVENSPCPYCGKVPKWVAMNCARGGGVFIAASPHTFNDWRLKCCEWGGSPSVSDPRKIVETRERVLRSLPLPSPLTVEAEVKP